MTTVQTPQPGTYKIDASHSPVEFVARHLMIAKVRGRFTDLEGAITIGERPEDSSVEVVVGTASVSTGDEGRDTHLRSADFFDVEQFPEMKFRSTTVRPGANGTFELDGELTIRDITRPVTLRGEFDGAAASPWGDERIAFSVSAEVNREDWGLTWNKALESGGFVVGKKATLDIGVEAIRA